MKKILTFILTAVILTSFASCSSKEMSTDNPNENMITLTDGENTVYKYSQISLPDELKHVTDIIYNEETKQIFLFGTVESGMICCFITDDRFGAYKPLKLGLKPELTENIYFDVTKENIFAVVEREDSAHLLMFTIDGELTKEMELDSTGYITSITHSNDGKLILGGEKCIFVETDGTVIEESDHSGNIFRLSDARLVVEKSGKGVTELRELSLDNMELGSYNVKLSESADGIFITGTEGFLAYIAQKTAVYGLRADNTAVKIIDFTVSGITDPSNITPISNNDFLAVVNGKLVRLTQGNMSEIGEISEITIAVAGKNDVIQGLAADFNSQSTKYNIKIKDYSSSYAYSAEGLEQAANDLETDIISGNIPDMVWLEPNETERLASKGAFADLYEFIDNDPIYQRDFFLPNYLKSCEIGGQLLNISPTFAIRTLGAKSRFVNRSNWNFDEFFEIYSGLPDNMELFEQGNNKEAVLYFITNDYADFIDTQNLTCNFDSEEFVRFLEFADTFPLSEEYDFEKMSCRNDTALLSDMYIMSFRDINVKKIGTFGEDMTFVGFPSNSENGSSFMLSNQFAIMADSPNKDGAWEFIRKLFNDDNISSAMDGIPITKSGLKLSAECALEKPFTIDEETGKKEYWNETITDWATMTEIIVEPMSSADKDKYISFIESITSASSGRSTQIVGNIVREESEAYFHGERSAKETAKIIQNRVETYLSEQYT